MICAMQAVMMHIRNAAGEHRVRLFLVAVCLVLAVAEWLLADRPSTALDLLLSVFILLCFLHWCHSQPVPPLHCAGLF
jgi:ABC-type dipeptide/oligopeptide/nickel transport system ATPase component